MQESQEKMTQEQFDKLSKWTVVHLTANNYLRDDCAYTVKGLRDRITKICCLNVTDSELKRVQNWHEVWKKIELEIISHVVLGKGNKTYKMGKLYE